MKRFLAAAAIPLLMLAMTLQGCGQTGKSVTVSSSNKLSIVCTVFPQYDWIRQILGSRAENVELTLFMDRGVDMHSYQPTVDDIMKISVCDMFVYVGGESDEWVEAALAEATNPDMKVIKLLDVLGDAAKTEDIVEGMEEDIGGEAHKDNDEEEHDDYEEPEYEEPEYEEPEYEEPEYEEPEYEEPEYKEPEYEEPEYEEPEYDEHVWLSLRNAEVFCVAIADALSSLDSGSGEEYRNNLAAYTEKLAALDSNYETAVNRAAVKTLLFGDRFPFRYLVDDYGLSYHAPFPGCSAETEASFETIVFLAGKADELNLNSIVVTESSDRSLAKTIISNTEDKNQQILVMDSMQSVTSDELNSETDYLSIMKNNLNTLQQALNPKRRE